MTGADPDRLATDSARPSVVVSGLTVSVGDRAILQALSFQASESRIGIVGRNGSGKTTLARALAGLVMPQSGDVRIAGIEVTRDRRAALRVIGILFQNPDHQIIFPTVGEEIAFGLRQLGQGKEQAQAQTGAILARFGKAHWSGAAIYELSQGQRHLVCLMAVLAMEPRVIVLDEPFSGLDIPTTLALTRYLDAAPATLVHISHDPAVLRSYDRILWLEAGRIAMDGQAGPVLAAFTERMNAIGAGDDLSDLTG